MTRPSSRARRVSGPTALLATLALGAAALAPVAVGGALASASAAPIADCAATFPIGDLAAGDQLDGRTVTVGTTPQQFTASVIGVLKDGIAPGVDMIMVKVDPTGLDIDPTEVKGIWQGMSGSPLYAQDGRLVGAVSYGLSWEQSWVAGVTPFGDMTEYLDGGTTTTVRLSGRTAGRVAAAAGVTTAQASKGFAQLPMPMSVAGAASRLLDHTAKQQARHPWLSTGSTAVGRAAAPSGPDADSIVAGGNLAASVSYGDVLSAGVGTATSVCDGKVVGFGHPLGFFGDTTLAMHPAESLYIQGDAPSFKVANIGDPVGTIFGDHLTGITGSFGALPKAASITATTAAGTRHRTGTSYVSLQDPDALAMTSYLQSGTNDSRVLDGIGGGTKVMTWKLTGTDAVGKAFDLSWTDRYLATYDVADETGFALGDVVYTVASMPGVRIDSVSATGDVEKSKAFYVVKRLEIKRGGEWSKLSKRRPNVVRAGKTFAVRAVLRSPSGVLRVPFRFDVPKNASGKLAMLAITGGASTRLDLGESIGSARKALGKAVRSDVLRAQFGRNVDLGDYYDEGDYRVNRGGPRGVTFTQTKTTAPGTAVLGGSDGAMFLIR